MDRVLEYISAEPFDDYVIKNFINKNGVEEVCDWTDSEAICVPMEDLAEFMDRCILTEFDEPYAIGAGYDKDEVYYEDRFPGIHVQSSEELLQDLMIDTPMEVRDFIAPLLSNEYWTSKDLYSPSTGEILYESWEEFVKLIKHKVRFMFFSDKLKKKKPTYESYTDPYSILDEIGEGIKNHNLMTSFQPNDLTIYRARQHANSLEISDILNLGSPPDTIAQSNRLSPAGISMFYGALDRKTSIIEVLNFGKVDETITVGKFTNQKQLNLIDFSKLQWISIFDEDKRHLRESCVLLRKFVDDLNSPISNDGRQHIDYVSTQVVIEYLKNSFVIEEKWEIHDMIYPSSKRKNKCCVVLFFTQEHLTENCKEDKFLLLDTRAIKRHYVRDITVSIDY